VEEVVAEYFHRWARNPKVRDWICCDSLSPEERERRIREIFGLSPDDMANPPLNPTSQPTPTARNQIESNQIKPFRSEYCPRGGGEAECFRIPAPPRCNARPGAVQSALFQGATRGTLHD
jgi:hypothetical protein